jgi:hypothetical protein
MNEKTIVAALLTGACRTNPPQNSGDDCRQEVMNTYEYFLERLAEKEAGSIPDALKPMVDDVRKKQRERQKARGE